MGAKLWIILIFLFISLLKMGLLLVHYRSAKNPIPENVADVYDKDTYLKWQNYHGETSRLSMLESLAATLMMTLFLVFDIHAKVANLFGDGFFALVLAVVFFDVITETVLSLPFGYYRTMKIEEKYGFNRSSKSTFVKDTIIGFVVSSVVTCLIVLAIYLSHMWLGNFMAILLSVFLCIFVLFANLLFPYLSRLQNKFTPLEEGSLRDKLTTLLTSHGYTVKDILVMDASRRTTKSNAYFSGFGKEKRIVLFDTLLSAMDEDEICAVFAHELGHGIHHDIPKLLCMSCLNMIFTALLAWGVLAIPAICTAFGFAGLNYGFAFSILGSVALPLVSQAYGIFVNAVSCRAEYKADAQAVTEGYGQALISGLKKLSRENFSHLSPSPLVVALEYNHPPLSQRISAITNALQKSQS